MAEVKELLTKYVTRYPGTIAWRVNKHASVIEHYLNPGEEVTYVFCGQKNNEWYNFFNTCVVALTNKRVLIAQKHILWGANYWQITPDLYNDMEIYTGMFFGKIVIDTLKETVIISNLSKRSLDEIETNISEFMMESKKKYNAIKEKI